MIAQHPVVSSNISLIGWDAETLFILFNSGGAYKYADVPYQTYLDFISAESVGKYFHAFIKPQYAFTALTVSPFN